MLVCDAIRCWISASHPSAAAAERHLQMLSLRVKKLTAQLPDSITVYGLFLSKGPVLQGAHYRFVLAALCRTPAKR